MKTIKKVLKKVNQFLKELASGAAYAINN